MINSTLCYIERKSASGEPEVLLLHRVKKKNDLNHDKWIGIGGKFEEGESPEDCMLREAREETGLEVKLTGFLGIFHNHDMVWANGDAAHVISAMYTAEIVSGEPRIDEESFELRFFGKDEFPELFAEDHIAALEAWCGGVRLPLFTENEYRKA